MRRGWSVSQMRERVQSLLFERSVISKQASDFTFVARHKRVEIDDDDFYRRSGHHERLIQRDPDGRTGRHA